ncbi:MAG: YHS domain-containing protein [Cellulosilyticaceae bacterium]
MTGVGDFFLNVFLIMMLVSLFNLVRYMFKIRKIMKVNKDNPNIKGISIVNGQVKVIENEAFPPVQDIEKDLVTDPECGIELEKKDAYRIFKNGKEYFFCSWECREKFLENAK